jgi:GNAT superfamily N-acetyltransferase
MVPRVGPGDGAIMAHGGGKCRAGATTDRQADRVSVDLSELQITEIDVSDLVAVRAAYDLTDAAQRLDLPDFPEQSFVDFELVWRHPWPGTLVRSWLAQLDEPVGVLTVSLPQREHVREANVAITVAPGHRRRGIGRALYSAALEYARQHGRDTIIGTHVRQLDGGVPRDPAFGAFAEAMGAAEALGEVRRRLDLATADRADWAAQLDRARAAMAGYSLVSWQDVAPDAYVADIARMDSDFPSEAPMGDLDVDPPPPDPARIREAEATLDLRQVARFHAGARHDASGRLVAWSVLSQALSNPEHAIQQITIVDPAHRGHRLGLAVKLANLELLLAHSPQLRFIDTWNAATNQHMIAINEQLGFRPVDGWSFRQQRLNPPV